jgi:hypothetical protein
MVLDNVDHGVEQENKRKPKAKPNLNVGEEISGGVAECTRPNPKMRRGLSVLLVGWKMGRTQEHIRV